MYVVCCVVWCSVAYGVCVCVCACACVHVCVRFSFCKLHVGVL